MPSALTLTALISEVQKYLSGTGTVRDDMPDSRVVGALNLGLDYMSQRFDMVAMQYVEKYIFPITADLEADATIPFGALVNMPRSLYSIRVYNGTISGKLKVYHPRVFDARMTDLAYTSRDIPIAAAQWGDRFEFYPSPKDGTSVTFRGIKYPVPFVTGQGAALNPLGGADLPLILWAVQYLYNSLGEYDRSAKFYTIFNRTVTDMGIDKPPDVPDAEFAAPGIGPSSSGSAAPWADPFVRSTGVM